MSRTGLPQGFVIFGTLAHRILVLMHENGALSHPQLLEMLREEGYKNKPQHLSTILVRLHETGFTHNVGRYRPPIGRSAIMFYYERRTFYEYRNVQPRTGTERSQKYRARKKVRVPSVFKFRGKIEVS